MVTIIQDLQNKTCLCTQREWFVATAMEIHYKTWCWHVRKPAGVPEHKSYEAGPQTRAHESRKVRRQRISERLCTPQKLWILLYVPSRPPFVGRRRNFYILRLLSNLMNIPNVNTYKNVFYISWFAGLISYIYNPATSSHFKSGLLKRHLWLASSRTPKSSFTKISALCDSRIKTPPDSRFPNFADSWSSEWRGPGLGPLWWQKDLP
jgi:hypothetical protein